MEAAPGCRADFGLLRELCRLVMPVWPAVSCPSAAAEVSGPAARAAAAALGRLCAAGLSQAEEIAGAAVGAVCGGELVSHDQKHCTLINKLAQKLHQIIDVPRHAGRKKLQSQSTSAALLRCL